MENASFVNAQVGTAASDNAQVKLAHTIPEAVLASGLSRSMLYLAISRGALRAKKCGARTLILDLDLRRFLRGLPPLAARPALPTASEQPPGRQRLRERAIGGGEDAA
jgi:hypothetical protein